jgi:hypothetical protein
MLLAGELFAIDRQDLSRMGCICWCHSGVFVWIWSRGMWHACDIHWCQFLALFVHGGCFHHFLLLLTAVTVPWEALWCDWLFGEWRQNEKLCYAARCSDLQNRSAKMDLMVWWSAILAVEFHIPYFQALLWLHMDSVQKHILRVCNQILWL